MMIKRTLVIATMCMLLLATAGATVTVAKQMGNSGTYQFDVKGDDDTIVGKLIINTVSQKLIFNGKGLTPDTTIYLTDEAYVYIAEGTVNKGGNVHMEAEWSPQVLRLEGPSIMCTAKTPFLAAPVITSPPAEEEYDAGDTVTLSWTEVPGAASYAIQGWIWTSYSAEAHPFNLHDILTTETTFPTEMYDYKGPGLIEWQVRAISGSDDVMSSPWSPISNFIVVKKLATPSIISPQDGHWFREGDEGRVTWTPVPGATGYETHITIMNEVTGVTEEDRYESRDLNLGSEYPLYIPHEDVGKWQETWSVRALYEHNTDLNSDWSDSIDIHRVYNLATPEITSPESGTTFGCPSEETEGTMSWTAVPGASYYTVEMTTTDYGGTVTTSFGIYVTSYPIHKSDIWYDVIWRVKAVYEPYDGLDSAWSTESTFVVRPPCYSGPS